MRDVSETKFNEYDPAVPTQHGLMEARGYTKVDGRWVAPTNTDEMAKIRLRHTNGSL